MVQEKFGNFVLQHLGKVLLCDTLFWLDYSRPCLMGSLTPPTGPSVHGHILRIQFLRIQQTVRPKSQTHHNNLHFPLKEKGGTRFILGLKLTIGTKLCLVCPQSICHCSMVCPCSMVLPRPYDYGTLCHALKREWSCTNYSCQNQYSSKCYYLLSVNKICTKQDLKLCQVQIQPRGDYVKP